MMQSETQYAPGFYPYIRKLKPRIGGRNNLGVGEDTNGNEYVLKRGPLLCVAEFVGASLCAAAEIPCCSPTIVCMHNMDGVMEHLYGAVLEPNLIQFDRRSILAWGKVVPDLRDQSMFSSTLAVDLSIGNDDRHADNWLVQQDALNDKHKLISIDFSNSWPACHPPHHPLRHPSANTMSIVKHWRYMGISFAKGRFHQACAKISSLDDSWLQSKLAPMVGVWLSEADCDELTGWWRKSWKSQVIDTIYCLETDGDWQ